MRCLNKGNTGIDNAKLYTQPADVALAFERLGKISDKFSIAASFGNVHGVYKPGNVSLQPSILKNSQAFVKEKFALQSDKPVNFVFHGGSGSSTAAADNNVWGTDNGDLRQVARFRDPTGLAYDEGTNSFYILDTVGRKIRTISLEADESEQSDDASNENVEQTTK